MIPRLRGKKKLATSSEIIKSYLFFFPRACLSFLTLTLVLGLNWNCVFFYSSSPDIAIPSSRSSFLQRVGHYDVW